MELPGEQLITRMWETLSEKGIGSLLRPWQMKREGIAQLELHRAELLANAQTEKDAELIRTGQKKLGDFSTELNFASTSLAPSITKARTEPTIDLPTVIDAVTQQNLEDSLRRHVNVAHAICFAEETLRGDTQDPPNNKIDDDWLFRWRDHAGEVSNESMQSLWGKILAGEVKSPGSFSLRALEFLRNLSQDEAKEIEYLSQFAIGDMIWRDDSLDIPFGILLGMQELGILSGVESIGVKRSYPSTENSKYIRYFTSNNKIIFIEHDDPLKKLDFPVYILTKIGAQILSLGKFTPNIKYLEQVATSFHQQGFSVSFADITHMTDTMVHFINKKTFEVS